MEQRQLCWAHLKRDLTAIAERDGVSKEIGLALLRRENRLFRWWHRVRDGTISREQLLEAAMALRAGFLCGVRSRRRITHCPKRKIPLGQNSTHSTAVIKGRTSFMDFLVC